VSIRVAHLQQLRGYNQLSRTILRGEFQSLPACLKFSPLVYRVHGCQGNLWRYNSHTESWEGNPVFQPDFRTYYKSLKNQENRTGIATQALLMFPKDLKVIMNYLDGKEAAEETSLTW
jgi:hypothetical protein